MQYIILLLIFSITTINAQTTLGSELTYQGNLTVNGAPVDGTFDFDLYAYDAANGGTEVGQFLVEDAQVNQGFFSVELDFGDTPFTGNQVWLEIRIRDGASNGSFQQLLPRYKINSTPYAIHAQFVGADSIGNIEIQDGSVTTSKLADDAINSDKIDDGSVMNADLADDAVNSDKIDDGSVMNSDLADDAVNTNNILNNTITTVDLADNIIGSNQINNTEVQARITGGCTQGQYVSAINQDGSINCVDAVDQSARGVCQSSAGASGVLINNVCVLDYDNTQSTDWGTATSSCAALGGDICSTSQYVAMTNNGGPYNNSLFYLNRPRWTQDFSDNDNSVKTIFIRSADNPSISSLYGYACCGNTVPEPASSNAMIVNSVQVTYLHDKEDTTWSAASQICHQRNADLCTKSQYVTLNDANTFNSASIRRASNDLSDNDGGLMDAVLGTNTSDNSSYTQLYAFACCGLSTKPVDNSCPGNLIGGVCTGTINDVDDTNFFDAARACHAEGANLCSKSQMQVIRDNGSFTNQCWTSDGADNDGGNVGGLLSGQPDNPNPDTDLFGYACCY